MKAALQFRDFLKKYSDKVIPYIAYADDVNIFVSNRKDLEGVLQNFEEYEKVSNMKINKEKSNLIQLKNSEEADERYQEEYEDSPIKLVSYRDAGKLKFLGLPLTGRSPWKEVFEKIKKQLWYPMLDNVPINVRAKLINTYIMSQIYGRDSHSPLSTQQIQELEKMIHDTHFRGIKVAVIKKLEEDGGFGLMDLQLQLHGKRAKVMHQILKNDESNSHTSFIAKESLQWIAVCFCSIMELGGERAANIKNWERADAEKTLKFASFPWYHFLDGTFEKFFNEKVKSDKKFREILRKNVLAVSNLIPHDKAYVKINDIMTVILPNILTRKFQKMTESFRMPFTLDIRKLWRSQEVEAFISWNKIFYQFATTNDNLQTELKIENLSKQQIFVKHLHKPNCEEIFVNKLKDVEDKEVTPESFKGISKKLQTRRRDVIIRDPKFITPRAPRTDIERGARYMSLKKNYQEFWMFVKKTNQHKPGYIEKLHLFNLGLIEHRFLKLLPVHNVLAATTELITLNMLLRNAHSRKCFGKN